MGTGQTYAPDAAAIERLAEAAIARLPAAFRRHLTNVVLRVEDFADEATLGEMGIDDPFALTGLYEGVPLTERSVEQSGTLPDLVRLEPGFDAEVLHDLGRAGVPTAVADGLDPYFGGVSALSARGAGSDPRRSGHSWLR